MPSHGADEPRVLIIGEAPGSDEDNAGVPFVGRSGTLLRQVLEEVGLNIAKDVRFTNVVRCRPPENKITKQAIMACRQFAVDDIQEYQPDYVFLMGNTPLSGILGETGISNWQGSIIKKQYDDKEITFVPLYHPAFILRDMRELDTWVDVILKVVESIDVPEVDDPFQIIHPKTVADFEDMYLHLRQYDKIVFDLETTSLDPFDNDVKIVAVAFAAGEKAYSFPLYHDEATEALVDVDVREVAKLTKRILLEHDNMLIGHNVKFDVMWVNKHLDMHLSAYGDSMLISHIIDSRAGIHGLKRLAGVYCDMYDYEAPLSAYIKAHKEADPRRGGNYGNIPLDVLLPYAAMDAKATLILHRVLFEKLTDQQVILYEDLIMNMCNVLTDVQSNGFKVDKFIAERYEMIYTIIRADYYGELVENKYVKKITAAKNKALKASLVGTKRKYTPYVFNFNSTQQRAELFFKYYHFPVLAKSKKTGAPSTSSKTYRKLEDKYPILKTIREFKLLGTILSKYLKPALHGNWLSDDGLIHTSFNQHTVVTGRLSSSDPVNLQNIPTPEKEPGTLLEDLPVKNILTHRDWIDWEGNDVQPGDLYGDEYDTGALVSADESGMELRVFASLAKCQPMLDIHKSGLDFHSMVAIMSIDHKRPNEITPDEISWFKKNKKEVRYRYKWTNWTLLYGGDAYTLHNLYDVEIDEARETIEMYYDLFPEVLEYKLETQAFAEDYGYIESPFGRREYLPHINDRMNESLQNRARRAAVNMPVQSGASDIVVIGTICLSKEMKKRGFVTKLVNTVHDSIVGDCPRREIVPYAELCKDVMSNIFDYAKIWLPRLDLSWMLCPLLADVEVGSNYGSEISFDEWREKYESNV